MTDNHPLVVDDRSCSKSRSPSKRHLARFETINGRFAVCAYCGERIERAHIRSAVWFVARKIVETPPSSTA